MLWSHHSARRVREIILRVADATRRISATGLMLRSSVAAATPSQQQLRRSGTIQPRTLKYNYRLASPRRAFFLARICHAKNDPPVTKIRPWASFGV